MKFKTLDGLEVKGRRVLVRADLNVPMDNGRVTDRLRLERQAPTIRELSDKGARVIVLSHFGRPKGKPDPSLSLKPVAPAFAEEIGRPVAFVEDCIGPKAEAAVAAMTDGDVLLLENTRFHPGEKSNDPQFVAQLAALGDIYVNDAFSAAHRAHASTAGLARKLPAYAGRAMEEELRHLEAALSHPERPLLAVVGGAKVSSKIALLENMVTEVETLVIGGAMANTFLAAEGLSVGRSRYEPDLLGTARKVIHMATESGCAILLPTDVVVAGELKAGTSCRTVATDQIGPDEMALDVGPKTIAAIRNRLSTTKTLVWNGPLGAFETEPFQAGTVAVARAVAELTRAGRLLSVAGGGDTVAALALAGVEQDFSYVSAAGGAFLEWLESKELPGVKALTK
jgi:phosphoglycerate kinase